MNNIIPREGWADDITTRAKTHYYKDGESLCGKTKDNFRLKHFKKGVGDVYANDCSLCVKKEKKL